MVRPDMILIGQVVIKSSGLTLIIAIAISLTIVTLIGAFFVGKMKEGLKVELFIKANRVSRYNLRMLYENIRIPIAIFVAMIYVMESLTNIASFSSIVNVKVTPYAFVFVINNYRVQFIIAACAIIIFGNAPYENETYRYMVSRSGKTAWGLGQVIYIIKMTLIYVAGIFSCKHNSIYNQDRFFRRMG